MLVAAPSFNDSKKGPFMMAGTASGSFVCSARPGKRPADGHKFGGHDSLFFNQRVQKTLQNQIYHAGGNIGHKWGALTGINRG